MTQLQLLLSVIATFTIACTQASNLFTAYSLHTDNVCTSVPKQVAYVASSDCTTTNVCAEQADGSKQYYMHQDCTTDCVKRTNTLFAGKPWVQLEINAPGSSCGNVVSTIAYLADGSCLVADNSSSSIIAVIYPNKSASITTYNGNECSGKPTKLNVFQAVDLQDSKCVGGIFHAKISDATTPVSALSQNSAPVITTLPWAFVIFAIMLLAK